MDQQRALARVGGDRRLLAELAGLFLIEYPRLLDELDKGLAAQDYRSAADAAHQLKGLLAQFAADGESRAAAKVEQACREGKVARQVQDLKRQMELLRPELTDLAQPSLL